MTVSTGPRRIDATLLRERFAADNGPRVLDVRTPAEYETAHIPGSYNVPLDSLREHREELRRHLDEDVVLVCRSGNRAEQAEKALAEVGLPGLHVLEGGFAAWQALGAPVVEGRRTWDLERQVRLVAGGIVAASVLGSTVVPRLKWLAGGIGTGLAVAALTDTCAMGMVLSKMPWNRHAPSCDLNQVVKALANAAD